MTTKTSAPDALDASLAADKPALHTVTVGEQTFDVKRKPPTLLLAELARVDSGDPEAIGTLAEFFEVTLGKDTYKAFKRAVYTLDVEDDQEALMGYMTEIIEATLGRPTK